MSDGKGGSMRRKKRQDMADARHQEDVAKWVRSVGRRDLPEERWALLEERIVGETASWRAQRAMRRWGERVWMGAVEGWRWSVAMVWGRSRIVVPAVGIVVLCVVGAWVTKKGDSEDRGVPRTAYSLYSSSARREPVSLYSVGEKEYVR